MQVKATMTQMASYYDGWRNTAYSCTECGWAGSGSALKVGEVFDALAEFGCPACRHTLLLVSHPTIQESRANWDRLTDQQRRQVEEIEAVRERWEREKLRSVDDLPDIAARSFVLRWDLSGKEPLRTVIKLGNRIIFNEPAVYEGAWRFEEVATILKAKYGSHLKDLEPTERSLLYLYGDRFSTIEEVDTVRRRLFSSERPRSRGAAETRS